MTIIEAILGHRSPVKEILATVRAMKKELDEVKAQLTEMKEQLSRIEDAVTSSDADRLIIEVGEAEEQG